MSKTYSTMLPLGSKAPSFSLPDIHGQKCSLDSFPESKAYLVMFICNHCPYVVHIREAMVTLAEEFQKQGVGVVAINSNDAKEYTEDSPEKMKEYAKKYHYSFPYLCDESQNVAKAFKAACTPDFFLFNEEKRLVYRGQFDDSRPSNKVEPEGSDLRRALTDLLAKRKVSDDQKPSMGCNIKWKAGNEPHY